MTASKKPTHVTVDDRKFIVDFDDAGSVVRIKERKMHAPGEPWECWYNAPYWSAKHHLMGSKEALPSRIIEAARKVK